MRNTEEKLVPDELREAYALGFQREDHCAGGDSDRAAGHGEWHWLALGPGDMTAPVLILVGYSRSINFGCSGGGMASPPC